MSARPLASRTAPSARWRVHPWGRGRTCVSAPLPAVRHLVLLGGLALLAGACTGRDAGGARAGRDDWAGVRLERPIPRPDFTLTDARGRPFDFLSETEGHVTLLFFGYTHCPDVCPVQMANLAEVLRELPLEVSREVKVVFVTTDPVRDTPERLREWLGALHPSFIGLRGSRDEVRALEERVGVTPSVVQEGDDPDDYFVGHAAQVIAFGADGPARLVYPWGTRQRDWLRDLPRLVGAAGPGGR